MHPSKGLSLIKEPNNHHGANQRHRCQIKLKCNYFVDSLSELHAFSQGNRGSERNLGVDHFSNIFLHHDITGQNEALVPKLDKIHQKVETSWHDIRRVHKIVPEDQVYVILISHKSINEEHPSSFHLDLPLRCILVFYGVPNKEVFKQESMPYVEGINVPKHYGKIKEPTEDIVIEELLNEIVFNFFVFSKETFLQFLISFGVDFAE